MDIQIKPLMSYIDYISESKIPTLPNIVGELFQSRDIAHIVHLSTGSYEKHVALNTYYEEIVDMIDRLVESYQGLYGKISIKIPQSDNTDIIKYLTNIHTKTSAIKTDDIDGEIATIIDEILELISKTLYKLKELS